MLFFNKLLKKTSTNDVITVVSGLPRSGTSMMMRMLEAGGLEAVTDNIRTANEDNPRGYYEFERVKQLGKDTSWLAACRGKVVKIISMLLYHLPADHHYKVVFMQRTMKEILASQRVMLQRSGEKEDGINDAKLAEQFEKHLHQVAEWIAKQVNIDVLYIKYSDILHDPRTHANAVNQFLGGWMDEGNMAKTVESSLYRQRQ
ncbi:MAG: sulfotransferase domain-containing protein [Deltaproteobacteria bacterium]|nr:sulfotransferase domain-containing protein [Deltaproteobacteria bacterium]